MPPVDIKTIRELTRLMRDNDLLELEVESPDFKVRMSKGQAAATPPALAQAPVHPAFAPAPVPAIHPVPAGEGPDPLAHCRKIIAPIPGTLYLKPNPESPHFVKVGDQVHDGQVVCLIEAMKVFNEIKCEGMSGVVRKVCIDDAQPVEYGTVLILIG